MKKQKIGLVFSVLLLLAALLSLAAAYKAPVIPAGVELPEQVDNSAAAQGRASVSFEQAIEQAEAVNQDVTGWLYVPATEINAPVLQSADNEYYLRRNIQREYDEWGSYFMDFECNTSSNRSLSRITIIYGHSLDDEVEQAHFSQLRKYDDLEFCRQNPYLFFQLSGQPTVVWQVFAAGKVPEDLAYIYPEPESGVYTPLLEKIREASTHDFAQVQVAAQDKILILSTCTSNPAQRYILAAKMVKVEDVEYSMG